MQKLNFNPSENLTLGVELELQLINPASGDLAPKAGELLTQMKPIECTGEIKPELTYSMVEINSTIHRDTASLHKELSVLNNALIGEAEKIGIQISGGGVHPFQKWSDRCIYPSYQAVYDKYDFLAKKFTVFGQHIHIGCSNPDDTIYLIHCFSKYIPHFIALSASSPVYEGVKTHFSSTRLHLIDAFPLSGHFPLLKNWRAFKKYFSKLVEFNVVKEVRNFYWDIRFRPDFGTLEIRICDTPLTLKRAVALAAYAQTLAAYFLAERPFTVTEDLYLPYAHNRFQASRHGLAGMLAQKNHSVPIQTDILETLQKISNYAFKLGNMSYLEYLRETTSNFENDAEILRKKYEEANQANMLPNFASELWKNDSLLMTPS